jgi:Protein of unknown function (DUF4054)
MAVPTYAQFIANELMISAGFDDDSVYSEGLVTQLLTESAGFCEVPFWITQTMSGQDRQYLGIIYLTAHKLALLKLWGIVGSDGTAGALGGMALGVPTSLSNSQGSQSVSFSRAGLDGTDPDAELNLTYWGRMFRQLRDSSAVVTGFTF